MKFWPSLSILALPALVGCATPFSYSVPEGQPRAYVRFKTMGEYYTYFWTIDRASCPDARSASLAAFSWTFQEALSDVRMLGSSGKPDKYLYERVVAADKPFYILGGSEKFATSVNDPGYVCSLGVGVTFKPEHHYEVEFALEAARCRVRVWELTQSGDDLIRLPEPSAYSFPARYPKHLCRR